MATKAKEATKAKKVKAVKEVEAPRSIQEQRLDLVRTLSDLLEDLMGLRIANSNRIGALERERGDSMPHLRVIGDDLARIEHSAELELARAWRKHELAPWARSIPGLGEKSVARLIAIIGDPAERPNVAKLWAYCGHGDPERSKRLPKGASQADLFKRGNPAAKTAVWRIASQFRRTMESPYRKVYEEARERYKDRTHESSCIRCGPSGAPALPGSPWSLAHQDAAALRLVGKRFLQDLWDVARRVRDESMDDVLAEAAKEKS